MTISFPTSPNVCFCTTWENRTDKICIKINKKTIKFYLSRYVVTNSQSITKSDCCAAAHLLNRPNILKYWRIQEATGKVWIGLEQNVIDTAINEWRKCLQAEPRFVGQHFKHFCRQLKNGQLDKLLAKSIKMRTKYVLCVVLIKQ